MAARSEVVVVTGMSGAGKSTALRALDDAGYYCVDNLPPAVIANTVRICEGAGIDKIALGIDVRVGAFLDASEAAIRELAASEDSAEQRRLAVLFLDATADVLIRRFSETRRPHPMSSNGDGKPLPLADAVELERSKLSAIRQLATTAVDTSLMSVHHLRRRVLNTFATERAERMDLRVLSFGFKHGMPVDANLVFDVRFLDNPYFVPELRAKSGEDPDVRDFVLSQHGCGELMEHIQSLLRFVVPRYQHEGKSYLTVAIGCTGGRHRSVAIAGTLADWLARHLKRRIAIVHRDLDRGANMSHVEGGETVGETSQRAPAADGSVDEGKGGS